MSRLVCSCCFRNLQISFRNLFAGFFQESLPDFFEESLSRNLFEDQPHALKEEAGSVVAFQGLPRPGTRAIKTRSWNLAFEQADGSLFLLPPYCNGTASGL